MIIIIIGIVVLLAAYNLKKINSPLSGSSGLIRIVGIVIIIFGILSKCIVQVDAGRVGVQSIFGSVKKETLNSGLNVINPLADVHEMDLKTQNYTMSGVHR